MQGICDRDRRVRQVILVEGAANFAMMCLKLAVGLATGSLAVLSDAAHSLSDIANNVVGWFAARMAAQPPDREHPYGHRKFEMLAVFWLATLLTVVAVEFVLGAFRREDAHVETEPWALAVMVAVVLTNIGVSTWENWMAKRLDSDLLAADARHTFADVATTLVAVAGWQVAARGYAWLDGVAAVAVAAMVIYMAVGLFRRAIPILVDGTAIDAATLARLASSVDEVREVDRVRSRSNGRQIAVDLIVRVAPELTTARSHEVADEVEKRLKALPGVAEVSVHVEPAAAGRPPLATEGDM